MKANWSYLKKGDVVDIIATTPGIGTASLEKDLLFLSEFVKKIGLTPRINYQALLNGAEYFSKESQEIRQQELYKALSAEDSKAIWFIRGGYGTSKLLPGLENLSPPAKPKLLIGYSDINCLHLWMHKYWQWPSLHARVLYEYLETQDQSDIESLKNIIFGKIHQVEFSNLIPLNDLAKQSSNIKAKITGGTIQVLQSGIGLNWQFDGKDKIVLFEEVFDRGVRIDRTLDQFSRLGLLKDAKAILFGDIVCGKEMNGSENCDLAIQAFAKEVNVPVLHIPGIGHGKLNHPLPLNSDAELIIDVSSIRLMCLTGGQ
jgi:muramoyltetrapeptide carboxypeptidase